MRSRLIDISIFFRQIIISFRSNSSNSKQWIEILHWRGIRYASILSSVFQQKKGEESDKKCKNGELGSGRSIPIKQVPSSYRDAPFDWLFTSDVTLPFNWLSASDVTILWFVVCYLPTPAEYTMSPPRSILQGYLYKKSTKVLNKEWKKKYVTLLDNGKLTYHANLHVSTRNFKTNEWKKYQTVNLNTKEVIFIEQKYNWKLNRSYLASVLLRRLSGLNKNIWIFFFSIHENRN